MKIPMQAKKDPSNPWIFLRGLSRETAHWGTFTETLEKELHATVYCIDFPGTGRFFREKSPNRIEQIVDHIQSNFKTPPGQYRMLAHSMGCLVALEWMKREPEMFLGAVFMNTSIRGISQPLERITVKGLWGFVKILFSKNNSRKREEIKFEMTCNNLEKKESTIYQWMQIQREQPVSFETGMNQLMAAAAYSAEKPRQSLLLLNSLGDKLVNPKCSQDIAKKWNVPVQTHPWAGHDIFHDDENWVIDQIKKSF